MCWARKCCFFMPLDTGSMLLGVISFVISVLMTFTATVLIIVEVHHQKSLLMSGGPHTHFLHEVIPLNKTCIDISLGVTLVIGLLWMLFSILLVLGLKENRPSFIVSAFSFGLVQTILCQLGSLLILLASYWIAATVLFIYSLINIHYLVVVHTVYEEMLRGKQFVFSPHRELDEESIMDNELQH